MPKTFLVGIMLVAGCARPVGHANEPAEPAPLVVPPIAATAAPPPRPSVVPPAPAGVKHARELIEHEEWIGREVVADIVEPLYDADHSSAADDGEYDVEVSEVGANRFKITPASSPDERAAGALPELPKDLRPPVRVTGILARSRIGLRIVAHAIAPIAFPTPVRAANGKAITDDPRRWDGQYVVVEDTWQTMFESSQLLTGDVWVSLYPSVTQHCPPPLRSTKGGPLGHGGSARYPVRLTGYVHTAGGHYGHLGMASSKLVATDVVYLDPKRPECR